MHPNPPAFDPEISAIVDYVFDTKIFDSALAYETAHYVLLDSLACAFLALGYPACTKLLGPMVPGASLKNGARVPGTAFQLEPVQAAFNLGTLIRWLDFNDTWLAAEWGHPSDNLGGILMLADYLSRQLTTPIRSPLRLYDILTAMIKAHEIQGIMALENSFNKVGIDHVVLVKVATAAVTTNLLGGSKEQIANAISLAWVDGQSLRTYRHAPNTGSRKSWAAGDATSRGVRLALIALTGEMGYPSALSAKQWGFYDASFRGKEFRFPQHYGSYVMENVLFKIAFPAEFHAQTAVECAFMLHPQIRHRLADISHITIKTQNAAMRIIDKKGPLFNPADRDHCLQYMVAIGLLFGELSAKHYEDDTAQDPRIDELRHKMHVSENLQFSQRYLDPDKRSIGNSLQVHFNQGESTEEITIEYPVGHRCRRKEGIPLLLEKFKNSVIQHFPAQQSQKILSVTANKEQLANMRVSEFLDLLSCDQLKVGVSC